MLLLMLWRVCNNMVVTKQSITGVKTNKEVIIASETSNEPVFATAFSMAVHTIPAHSVGPDGYIVIDFFATRAGSDADMILIMGLGGLFFVTSDLTTGQSSYQSRIIIYADHANGQLKTLSDSAIISRPYYKGSSADQESLVVDTRIDNILTIGVVMFGDGDSFILEAHTVKTFNPAGPSSVITNA